MPEQNKRKVLFSKDHVAKHPHAHILNRLIRSNRWGKEKDVHITYRKANGDVVKRKVRPLFAKKDVLVVHDHDRNAYRSFKLEGIQSMEKTAFERGFEKRASGTYEIPLDTPEKQERYKKIMQNTPLRWVLPLGSALGTGIGTYWGSKDLRTSLGLAALTGALSYGGGHLVLKHRLRKELEAGKATGYSLDDAQRLRSLINGEEGLHVNS